MTTLAEALPLEMARVRDEVLPVYESLGREGGPAAYLMRADLDAATLAIAQGDVIAMIQVFESLKDWSV